MTDTNVAHTILQQLGGNRFSVMTGANTFVAHENALSFHFPRSKPDRGAAESVNYCKITLNPSDLYDVEFGRIHGANYKVVERHSGLYFTDLRSTFEHATGRYTSLGTLGGDRDVA